MPASRFATVALLLGLAACGSSTAPPDTTGTRWRTLPIPSGGATTLSLHVAGSAVTGSGQHYGLMGRPGSSFSISGTETAGALQLTMTYHGGATAHFDGVEKAAELQGTWTPASQPAYAITFVRE